MRSVALALCLGLSTSAFSFSWTDFEPEIDQLKLEVRKLNNQVAFLVEQNQKLAAENNARSLNQVRGLAESNQHQIQQLESTWNKKLSQCQQQVATLQQTFEKELKAVKTASHSTMDSKSEQLFQSAFKALSDKEYDQASRLLRKYYSNYPVGEHASESMFLRAQIALATGNPKTATSRFKALLSRYPRSHKAPDTYLNLGVIALASGDKASAKDYLSTVVRKYPETQAAAQAKAQLKKIPS